LNAMLPRFEAEMAAVDNYLALSVTESLGAQ
jgi:hypothetical protein